MKENLLVSSCLAGNNCKYSGGNNYCDKLDKLKEKYHLIFVCPEVLGHLIIPRSPSEIIGDKVMSKSGLDVTSNYHLGATKSLAIAQRYHVKKALLKEKSPSCGTKYIYDGTFSGKLISGKGITAKLLSENNIAVYSEDEIELLLAL